MSWPQRIDNALSARREQGLWRTRQVRHPGTERMFSNGHQQWLNFASNDYLGMSQHPAVIRAWQAGAARYGVGSGGSGHVTGYTRAHAELETSLSGWLGYPRALLFISGFAANHAVISALMQQGDRLLADKLSHASLLEAAMQSPAVLRRFAHNDAGSLSRLLAGGHTGEQLVVTEGVFSMDGDQAPLPELAQLTQQSGTWLMVDDAHGIGVLGEGGRGSCWQAGIQPDILVVTFGKAFGASGAAVLCSEAVADYLVQFARHLIYSTSLPPAQAEALSAALAVIRHADESRETLQRHIGHFRAGAAGLPWALCESSTAIQPLIIGDNAHALHLAQCLREQGIWVTAIRPPTVPPGTARLRFTLTAAHKPEDIDRLLEVLYALARE